jgi:hypothetical protein
MEKPFDAKDKPGITRRTFLGVSLASGAALFAARSDVIFGAESSTPPTMVTNPTWKLGGDLTVNRLGFGAMRITGEGIWGWPPDRENALKVLRRAVELGANLIDTTDAYGPGDAADSGHVVDHAPGRKRCCRETQINTVRVEGD